MTSQEAKQFLESQSNVVVGMVLQQEWDQLQSWYLESIQTIGLNEYSQPLAEEARQFFERMTLFHNGEMPKEEAQTLIHEEALHLVDLLEERERGAKMLQGVKSLRMKYRQKNVSQWLGDISLKVRDLAQSAGVSENIASYENIKYAIVGLGLTTAALGTAWASSKIFNWLRDRLDKKSFSKTYPPRNPPGWGAIEGGGEIPLVHPVEEELDLGELEFEPEDEDIFAEDYDGPFYLHGDLVAYNIEELQEWMQANQWYPNVWVTSDHGNLSIVNIWE